MGHVPMGMTELDDVCKWPDSNRVPNVFLIRHISLSSTMDLHTLLSSLCTMTKTCLNDLTQTVSLTPQVGVGDGVQLGGFVGSWNE